VEVTRNHPVELSLDLLLPDRRLLEALVDLILELFRLGELSPGVEEGEAVSYAPSPLLKRRLRQRGEQDGLGLESTLSSRASSRSAINRIPRLTVKSMVLRIQRTMALKSIDSFRFSVQDLNSRPYTTTPFEPDSIQ
jgi:hypothetical protein